MFLKHSAGILYIGSTVQGHGDHDGGRPVDQLSTLSGLVASFADPSLTSLPRFSRW